MFLDKLWTSYLKLFEKVIKDQSDRIQKLEQDGVLEQIRMHNLYQKRVSLVQQLADRAFAERDAFEEKYKKIKYNINYLYKNWGRSKYILEEKTVQLER